MAIKFLGAGVIDRLVSQREQNGKYLSGYDFCLRNYGRELNRKALEGLVKSGALDCVEPNRRQMLYNIDGILTAVEAEKRFSSQGQLNLFGEMDSVNTFQMEPMPEMDKDVKLSLEKEATGLYLSGHPLDKYASLLNRMGLTTTEEILSGKVSDSARVTLAGIVDNLKVRQLKNGNILASAFIEDMYSSIGITIFSKAYEQFKEFLQSGKPLIIKGKVSEREDREPEVILERAEEIPEREMAKPKPSAGLYIKIDSLNSDEFAKTKEILANFKGNNPVIIVAVKENRRLAAPKELYVAESEELMHQLSTLLGEENVKFVK